MVSQAPAIVLLDSKVDFKDIKEIARFFSRAGLNKGCRCLCWSTPIAEILKGEYNFDIQYENATCYLSQQELEQIELSIWEWLSNWYNDKELGEYKEFIFYKGFSLANFLDTELYNLLLYAMRNIAAMQNFILKNNVSSSHALVLSKTDIYSNLSGGILKGRVSAYKIYRLSRTGNCVFNKPIFYDWGKLPSFKSALISMGYSLVEFFSDAFHFVMKCHRSKAKKIIIIEHKVLENAIEKLLEDGYEIFFPNNINRFLTGKGNRKRIYYINTFNSMKIGILDYIAIRFFEYRSLSLAKEISERVFSIKKSGSRLSFKDIDFSMVIRGPLINLLKKLPVFLAVCKRMECQFRRHKFDLFITNSTFGETRFYWHLCKIYGVKNAGYPHGIMVSKNFYNQKNNHVINRAEYLFLWGKKIKEEGLLRGEFDGNEQIVVGNMRYDFINRTYDEINRRELGLNDTDKIILFDYSDNINFSFYCFYLPDYCDKVLFSLLRIMPKFKDLSLIIKAHPLSDPKRCRYFLQHFKTGNKVLVLHKYDVMPIIPLCSAVVSPGATTLCVDTVVNNVPFIAANFSKFPYIPFQGYKAFIEVFDENALEDALRKTLYDPNFSAKYREDCQDFIRDFCHKLDGNSTNRFVSGLENLLRGNSFRNTSLIYDAA